MAVFHFHPKIPASATHDPVPIMSYRFISHTADLAFEVKGRTLEELFGDCARALFDSITDYEKIRGEKRSKLEVTGLDPEDLLVNWLRELLGRYFEFNELYRDFQVALVDEKSLSATFLGETRDPRRHPLKNEIKAVTYSDVNIVKHSHGYNVRIIMDV